MRANAAPQVAMFGMIRIPHRGRIAVQLSRAGDLLWEVVFRGSTRGHASSRSDRAEAAEMLRLNPQFSLGVHKQRMPIKDPAALERYLDGLRKAGLK